MNKYEIIDWIVQSAKIACLVMGIISCVASFVAPIACAFETENAWLALWAIPAVGVTSFFVALICMWIDS